MSLLYVSLGPTTSTPPQSPTNLNTSYQPSSSYSLLPTLDIQVPASSTSENIIYRDVKVMTDEEISNNWYRLRLLVSTLSKWIRNFREDEIFNESLYENLSLPFHNRRRMIQKFTIWKNVASPVEVNKRYEERAFNRDLVKHFQTLIAYRKGLHKLIQFTVSRIEKNKRHDLEESKIMHHHFYFPKSSSLQSSSPVLFLQEKGDFFGNKNDHNLFCLGQLKRVFNKLRCKNARKKFISLNLFKKLSKSTVSKVKKIFDKLHSHKLALSSARANSENAFKHAAFKSLRISFAHWNQRKNENLISRREHRMLNDDLDQLASSMCLQRSLSSLQRHCYRIKSTRFDFQIVSEEFIRKKLSNGMKWLKLQWENKLSFKKTCRTLDFRAEVVSKRRVFVTLIRHLKKKWLLQPINATGDSHRATMWKFCRLLHSIESWRVYSKRRYLYKTISYHEKAVVHHSRLLMGSLLYAWNLFMVIRRRSSRCRIMASFQRDLRKLKSGLAALCSWREHCREVRTRMSIKAVLLWKMWRQDSAVKRWLLFVTMNRLRRDKKVAASLATSSHSSTSQPSSSSSLISSSTTTNPYIQSRILHYDRCNEDVINAKNPIITSPTSSSSSIDHIIRDGRDMWKGKVILAGSDNKREAREGKQQQQNHHSNKSLQESAVASTAENKFKNTVTVSPAPLSTSFSLDKTASSSSSILDDPNLVAVNAPLSFAPHLFSTSSSLAKAQPRKTTPAFVSLPPRLNMKPLDASSIALVHTNEPVLNSSFVIADGLEGKSNGGGMPLSPEERLAFAKEIVAFVQEYKNNYGYEISRI